MATPYCVPPTAEADVVAPAGTVMIKPLDTNLTVSDAVFPLPLIAVTVPRTVQESPGCP
jgi:hypothetical protein